MPPLVNPQRNPKGSHAIDAGASWPRSVDREACPTESGKAHRQTSPPRRSERDIPAIDRMKAEVYEIGQKYVVTTIDERRNPGHLSGIAIETPHLGRRLGG